MSDEIEFCGAIHDDSEDTVPVMCTFAKGHGRIEVLSLDIKADHGNPDKLVWWDAPPVVGDTRETFSPGTVGYELLGMVESLHARANAAEAEVNRLTECLEAMNASADILDEKIRVLSGSNQRDADLRQCPKCGGDRLRTDFTGSGRCHAPFPTGQE